MKKTAWIAIGLLLLSGSSRASGLRLGVRGSLFSSENAVFRDVYGSPAKLGFEAGWGLSETLSVWVGIDQLSKKGEMTESKEETSVRLTPLSLGARYEVVAGRKLLFHLGAGVQQVFFKESAPLGTVKESALGVMARAGGMYRLGKRLSAGLFLAWSTCRMAHQDVKFKVGGLDLGAGLELRL